MSKRWAASALTGGEAGALDAINGSLLSVGDTANVIVPGGKAYHYALISSSDAESVPDIIAPDTNGTGKRWQLVEVYVAGGIPLGDPGPVTRPTKFYTETGVSPNKITSLKTRFPSGFIFTEFDEQS